MNKSFPGPQGWRRRTIDAEGSTGSKHSNSEETESMPRARKHGDTKAICGLQAVGCGLWLEGPCKDRQGQVHAV